MLASQGSQLVRTSIPSTSSLSTLHYHHLIYLHRYMPTLSISFLNERQHRLPQLAAITRALSTTTTIVLLCQIPREETPNLSISWSMGGTVMQCQDLWSALVCLSVAWEGPDWQ